MSWRASVLTLFPEMFPGPLGHSLAGRAHDDGRWSLELHDIKVHGRHRAVDDRPFGGGAGMVMRPDVADAAIRAAGEGLPLVYLTPRGRRFDHAEALRLASGPGVVLLCGRYEGVDERVLEAHAARELSVGDYVLSGGELAAMVLLDACIRLIPGVIGKAESAETESFVDGLLEHPHYTRPACWNGRDVPDVLLSGDHGAVASWRRDASERATRERRPDLWATRTLAGATPCP